MRISSAIADVVVGLRLEVAMLHAELPRCGLVVWTAGNVSARVPNYDLLVPKERWGFIYDAIKNSAGMDAGPR